MEEKIPRLATKICVDDPAICSDCNRTSCALKDNGMTDLCKGKKKSLIGATPAPTPSSPYTENIVYSANCIIHKCSLGTQVPICEKCRLEPGSEDLCRWKKNPIVNPITPDMSRRSPPKVCKGYLKDFWTKRPSSRLAIFRDNSKYLGFFDPESVEDRMIDFAMLYGKDAKWNMIKGIPVFKWEFRAFKEDPDTPRRVYVGDDMMIRESELDHYKDGGYMPDDDREPVLTTPYDQGLDEDKELNKSMQEPQMWRQQGMNHHKLYQHTTHVNYVVEGSYSRRVRKIVYQPERVSLPIMDENRAFRLFSLIRDNPEFQEFPEIIKEFGLPRLAGIAMAEIENRNVIEYPESTVVMRKQYLPTLHPIMVGNEAEVIGSSTPMTRKDNRFLEVRRYEKDVVERHRECLIKIDEIAEKKRVAIPA